MTAGGRPVIVLADGNHPPCSQCGGKERLLLDGRCWDCLAGMDHQARFRAEGAWLGCRQCLVGGPSAEGRP